MDLLWFAISFNSCLAYLVKVLKSLKSKIVLAGEFLVHLTAGQPWRQRTWSSTSWTENDWRTPVRVRASGPIWKCACWWAIVARRFVTIGPRQQLFCFWCVHCVLFVSAGEEDATRVPARPQRAHRVPSAAQHILRVQALPGTYHVHFVNTMITLNNSKYDIPSTFRATQLDNRTRFRGHKGY